MLKLNPNPTFKAKVEIREPGGAMHEVTVEFKHRTKDELEAFCKSEERRAMSEPDTILAVATGWEGIDAPFNAESAAALCQNYQGSALVIVEKYLAELSPARLGN
jgi:hypothetical protein